MQLILLEGKATGIGENSSRKYGYIIALRIVEFVDSTMAKCVKLDWLRLKKLRDRMLKEIPEVIGVLHEITDKPRA